MLPFPRTLFRVALGVCLACFFVLGAGARVAAEDIRALWVVRTTLTSPAAIDAMVNAARDGGFNTLLVQVRGRGDAYYTNAQEPRAIQLARQPASFDPLDHVITRAHRAGLKVHAWINVNLVASAIDVPTDPRHVINRHPEWLMVPRELAGELHRIDPSDRRYLARLADYVRSRTFDLEGLYVSPLHPRAAEYTTRIVADVVKRYPVDGIHLDYVRFPADDFDFSRESLDNFRREVARDLTGSERHDLDDRLEREPFAYVDALPERWLTFRQERLTKLVTDIRRVVRSARPSAVLSAAVVPEATEAATHRMQDWHRWITTGLLDVLCPMVYTTDAARFVRQVSSVKQLAGSRPVWTGIGAYQLSRDQILANVQAAREIGVAGIILFSYDSLAGTPRGPSHAADIGRAIFGQ